MSLRIRKNGRVLCAAIHPEKKGDLYINDALHYYLSVEKRVLFTEPMKYHKKNGEWWWINDLPKGRIIET